MRSINNNLSAMPAQRHLGNATSSLQERFSRLSSGLRIANAKDDAAGLSIAESLSMDRRIYSQGIRNISDGISYMNIKEGAAGELKNILFRLRELSTQASNGTLGFTQRRALNQESELLIDEYSRILETTEFNGIKLFGAGTPALRVQAGFGELGGITLSSETIVGDGTFGAQTTYGVGIAPSSISTSDFNGDGISDLVVTNHGSNNLSILLGNGDGTFGTQTTYSLGSHPYSIAISDFNGDGVPDLVAANAGHDNLSVLLGNGDGTFMPQNTYSAGSGPDSIAIGDFNGDGIADLVATNYASNDLSILLGNGDGTFGALSSYNVGTNPRSVAVGDFNGDGVSDLVAANSNSGNLSVFLGNGDGTFNTQTTYNVGSPWSVAVGDFNGDGVPDLVATNHGSYNLSVLLGNGNGTFGAQTTYSTGGHPASVSIGDLNGDGISDLVVANSTSDNLSVLLGNGDGTFGAHNTYNTGSNPWPVTIGDFNGDGVSDLVTANHVSNNLSVLLGNSTSSELILQPLQNINLSTRANTLASQSIIDGYMKDVNKVLGSIGAGVARLETAASKLRVEVENYAAAESQIRDVDVATESSELIKSQIQQEAAAAVLGKANLQPELVLKLLETK